MVRLPIITLVTIAMLSACSSKSENKSQSKPAPEVAEQPAPAVPENAVTVAPDPALRSYLGAREKPGSPPLSYIAKTHGEGDRQLTLVYFRTPEYCGSGGCNLLVLRRKNDKYEKLGELTVVRTPVRILSTSTNGMPDLGVRVSGGGSSPQEALIPFDGARYASNPTVPPARPAGTVEGVTLISDQEIEGSSH